MFVAHAPWGRDMMARTQPISWLELMPVKYVTENPADQGPIEESHVVDKVYQLMEGNGVGYPNFDF